MQNSKKIHKKYTKNNNNIFLLFFYISSRITKIKVSCRISRKKREKNTDKLSKDPRKVQFLFLNDRKLISHFSRIFW
jgi:hypothetical protein